MLVKELLDGVSWLNSVCRILQVEQLCPVAVASEHAVVLGRRPMPEASGHLLIYIERRSLSWEFTKFDGLWAFSPLCLSLSSNVSENALGFPHLTYQSCIQPLPLLPLLLLAAFFASRPLLHPYPQ